MRHIGRSYHGWLVIIAALLSVTGCLEKSESEGFASDIGSNPTPPGNPAPPPPPGSGQSPGDVSFSVSVTGGVIPLEVQFTAPQQSEISEYQWNFGDGTDVDRTCPDTYLFGFWYVYGDTHGNRFGWDAIHGRTED